MHKFGIVLAVAGLLGTGCSVVAVNVPVTRPAEINLAQYRNLSVGPFEAEAQSMSLSGALATAVVALAEHATGAELFQRDWRGNDKDGTDVALHLHQAVMGTARFYLVDFSRLPDEKAGGKLNEPTLLLVGKVTEHDAKRDLDQKSVKRGSGKKQKTVTEYTSSVTVAYAINLQLIDFSNGQVFLSRDYNCSRKASDTSEGHRPEKIATEPLFRACKEEVAARFVKAIAPYEEIVQVRFRKDGALPELEIGIDHAKRGDWNQAVAVFKAAVDGLGAQTPEVQAMAWWNLGLAYEYSSMFKEAEEALVAACRLHNENEYKAELSNVRRLAAEKAALQQQQFQGTPQTPESAS
jgi:tetratricopeptide (TPR) repeat protein